MNQVYIRRSATKRETASAAALAVCLGAAVGAFSYYLTRAFLARDRVPDLPPPPDVDGDGSAEETE